MILFVDPIVADCQSMDILTRDFLHFCTDSVHRGATGNLPPVRTSFPAFAAWQAEACKSGYFNAAMSYWHKQWATFGASRIILEDFSFALAPAAETGFTQGNVHLAVDAATRKAIRQGASQHSVTLYAFFVAAFSVLLKRYTGRSTLGFWSTLSNRKPITADVVGWFTNSHLIGLGLASNQSCKELLEQARAVVLGGLKHQELPLAHLWNVLACRPRFRDLGVKLEYTRYAPIEPKVRLPSGSTAERTRLSDLPTSLQPTLGVNVEDYGSQFSLHLKYPTACFPLEAMQELPYDFGCIAGKLASDGDAPIAELLGGKFVPKAERSTEHPMAQLLVDGGDVPLTSGRWRMR